MTLYLGKVPSIRTPHNSPRKCINAAQNGTNFPRYPTHNLHKINHLKGFYSEKTPHPPL